MRRLIAVAVAVAVFTAVITPASADTPESELDSVKNQISQLTSQVNNAKAESRQVGEQLTAAQARLSDVQAVLQTAEANVAAIDAQIADQESKVAELQSQVDDLQAQLVDTTVRIASTEENLSSQAVELYMNASMSVGTVVLGFDSVDELAVGMTYAGDVAGASENLLNTFSSLRKEQDRQRTAVENNRKEAAGVLESLASERVVREQEAAKAADLRDQAAAELTDAKALLSSIQSQIDAYEHQKDDLEQEAKRIEAEIAEKQRKSGQAPTSLLMPVNGWISSYFGWRIHPIFGTKKLHTGIDLAAIAGTPIYAAAGGTVIMAGPYGGYGNATVIDHGGGMSTLYGHQSRITVSVGEDVNAGERIGYVGCTGYCTGDHLHFEVRINGKPVDPLPYLRG